MIIWIIFKYIYIKIINYILLKDTSSTNVQFSGIVVCIKLSMWFLEICSRTEHICNGIVDGIKSSQFILFSFSQPKSHSQKSV